MQVIGLVLEYLGQEPARAALDQGEGQAARVVMQRLGAEPRVGPVQAIGPEVQARRQPDSRLGRQLERQLRAFQPCGYGNPTPLLASYNVKVVGSRTVGADARHLKLTLTDGRVTMDAIAFQQGAWLSRLPSIIDVAYHLEINMWNGEQRLQLNVRDLRAA